MPIFWRYLLKTYFKVFFLTLTSFIILLFVIKFKDLAKFIALSSNIKNIGLYALYQIPGILPMAIPIASFLASILLFQKLSKSNELTALRASGFSLKNILLPIFFSGFFLFLLNFFLCSYLSPIARIRSKEILYQNNNINPFLLLQKQNNSKIKNCFIDMDEQNEKTIKNLIIFQHQKKSNRIQFFSAKNLFQDQTNLKGKNISHITYLPKEQKDALFIENQKEVKININEITSFLYSKKNPANINQMPLQYLFINHNLTKLSAITEIMRRIALSFSAFSFTFIGCAFGLEISRSPSKKGLAAAFLLTLCILLTFVFGKALKYYTVLPCSLYLIPQPFILLLSILKLKRVAGGIE